MREARDAAAALEAELAALADGAPLEAFAARAEVARLAEEVRAAPPPARARRRRRR